MKIRITGTAAELQAITELMKGKDYVRSISQPYKNRGEYSKDYRLYVETYDLQPEQLKQIREPAEVKQIRETTVYTQAELNQIVNLQTEYTIKLNKGYIRTLEDLAKTEEFKNYQLEEIVKELIKRAYKEHTPESDSIPF